MKPFKTASEQVSILKKRGISISNDSEAEEFLITRNYYSMINGYAKYFTTSTDVYNPSVTLHEIERVFIFDKAIKEILFMHLLEIEKYLKAFWLTIFACLIQDNMSISTLSITNVPRQKKDLIRLM